VKLRETRFSELLFFRLRGGTCFGDRLLAQLAHLLGEEQGGGDRRLLEGALGDEGVELLLHRGLDLGVLEQGEDNDRRPREGELAPRALELCLEQCGEAGRGLARGQQLGVNVDQALDDAVGDNVLKQVGLGVVLDVLALDEGLNEGLLGSLLA